MFPNVRLMIVAVLASILGISCALGLFAEFRVSHDSFLRESNANAPMQLGADHAAPARVVNTAVPFEFRFQAQPPPAAVEPAGRAVISEHEAAVEAAPVAPMAASAAETAVSPASPASTPETPAINSPAPEPALAASPPDSVSQTPVSAATGSIAARDTQRDAKPGATDDLAARTPPAAAPLSVPETKIVPESANSAAPGANAPTMRRRRPIIGRRLQRSRPAASAPSTRQNFIAAQPAYQWAPQFGLGSPRTVRRRVIVRRARPARQPIAQPTTPQTTVSNTSPVNPPE